MDEIKDSFTFTVGKLDAGMAILIGERAHLIEFPSVLLPTGVSSGSIVNISVNRNAAEEKRQRTEFWALQDDIFALYGKNTPVAPKLEIRNITQTSVTLEWPKLELATAKLRSLEIYRNGQRLAAIPSPLQNTSTKLSALQVASEYTFQLILKTTAGTFPSNIVNVRTHAMSDTSGISVCFGNVQDPVLLESAKLALNEMKAKWSDRIQIDTTHFVCTTPAATPSGARAAGNASGGIGAEYQKALQLSIPIVQPQWVLACLQEQKMVSISSYYLGTTSNSALSTATFSRNQTQTTLPSRTTSQTTASPPATASPTKQTSTTTPPSHPTARRGDSGRSPTEITDTNPPPPPHDHDHENSPTSTSHTRERTESPSTTASRPSRKRNGTMNKEFKFPPEQPPTIPPPRIGHDEHDDDHDDDAYGPEHEHEHEHEHQIKINGTNGIPDTVTPVELPPPTPIKKDSPNGGVGLTPDADEDVGETVEVDLS